MIGVNFKIKALILLLNFPAISGWCVSTMQGTMLDQDNISGLNEPMIQFEPLHSNPDSNATSSSIIETNGNSIKVVPSPLTQENNPLLDTMNDSCALLPKIIEAQENCDFKEILAQKILTIGGVYEYQSILELWQSNQCLPKLELSNPKSVGVACVATYSKQEGTNVSEGKFVFVGNKEEKVSFFLLYKPSFLDNYSPELGQSADIASTLVGTLSSGLVEMNPLFKNPANMVLKLILPKAIENFVDYSKCPTMLSQLSNFGYGAAASNIAAIIGAPHVLSIAALVAGIIYMEQGSYESAQVRCLLNELNRKNVENISNKSRTELNEQQLPQNNFIFSD